MRATEGIESGVSAPADDSSGHAFASDSHGLRIETMAGRVCAPVASIFQFHGARLRRAVAWSTEM